MSNKVNKTFVKFTIMSIHKRKYTDQTTTENGVKKKD